MKEPLEIAGLSEIGKAFEGESDRGAALIGAAFLDDAIEQLLRANMLNDEKKVDSLFDPNGPVSTFSARINLSFCLGLIPKIVQSDLHLIREIRNDFAHVRTNLSFRDERTASRCRELGSAKIIYDQAGLPFRARTRFTFACVFITGYILLISRDANRESPSDDQFTSNILKAHEVALEEFVRE